MKKKVLTWIAKEWVKMKVKEAEIAKKYEHSAEVGNANDEENAMSFAQKVTA